MKKCIQILTLSILLIFNTCIDGFSQKKIMFLGRSADVNEHACDNDLVVKLKDWGYTVDYITELPSAKSGYNGYSGLFISETVPSIAGMSFSTNDYPIPCICLEGWSVLSDRWGGWVTDPASAGSITDWGMATGQGENGGETIIIKDASHYITKDFAIEQEVTWSKATGEDLNNVNPISFKEVDQKYSAKLAQAKSYQEPDFFTMVAVDSNYDDLPNRMFIWGIMAVGLEGKDAKKQLGTNDFYKIIEKASEWAYLGKTKDDNPDPTSMTVIKSGLDFDVYPNPATESLNIRYFSATSDNSLKLSILNLAGKEIDFIGEKECESGYNFFSYNCDKLDSGIYLVKLQTKTGILTKKITIK